MHTDISDSLYTNFGLSGKYGCKLQQLNCRKIDFGLLLFQLINSRVDPYFPFWSNLIVRQFKIEHSGV